MTDPINAVAQEANLARLKFGDFTSTHEAMGVLSEEWDELRAAIHANSIQATSREAKQVAAVAFRLFSMCERALADDPDVDAMHFKTRSGA